jgi:hypothetical protein
MNITNNITTINSISGETEITKRINFCDQIIADNNDIVCKFEFVVANYAIYIKIINNFHLYDKDIVFNKIISNPIHSVKKIHNSFTLCDFKKYDILSDRNFAIYYMDTVKNVTRYNIKLITINNNDDKEIAEKMIDKYPKLIKHLSESLKDNLDLMTTAVKNDPYTFQYVSKDLKNNKDFVFFALSKNGMNLEHVSDELKLDPEVVIEALYYSRTAIKYIPDELITNENFMMNVINIYPKFISIAPINIRNNRVTMMNLINKDIRFIDYLSDELLRDKYIVDLVVRENPNNIKYFPYFSDDIDIMNIAIMSKNHDNLRFGSKRLRMDKTFTALAVDYNIKNSKHVLDRAGEEGR